MGTFVGEMFGEAFPALDEHADGSEYSAYIATAGNVVRDFAGKHFRVCQNALAVLVCQAQEFRQYRVNGFLVQIFGRGRFVSIFIQYVLVWGTDDFCHCFWLLR